MADVDILALYVAYLDGVLDSEVAVATRVPPGQRPAKFVQPRLIGWPKLPPVRRIARISVDCWGNDVGDEDGAMALGIAVRDATDALYGTELLGSGLTVYRIEESAGLHQSEDPQSHIAQASATYAITHRDNAVIR